jgi:hypothetical protein
LTHKTGAALSVIGAPGLANASKTGGPGGGAIGVEIALQLAALASKQSWLTGSILRAIRSTGAALGKRHSRRENGHDRDAKRKREALEPPHDMNS